MQLTFFVFLPQLLLSGFMFPFEGMPILARQLAIAMPLTLFIDLALGIVLRGAGISELLVSVYPLVLFFVVTMSVAVLRCKKRLD